jgi:hypothetical protein
MADIKYIVTMDASGALKEIKPLGDEIDKLKGRGDETHKSLGSLWQQFALGELAADALKKGISLLTNFVKDSITAAMEAETAENNLAAALDITGRSVEPLLDHFKKYSSELQKQTIYEDDAIQGAQALLIQLTNLDREGIDKATRGAIGMASVFKMDLESAATLVAKAMAGSTETLGRYGIKVDENLPKSEKQAQLLEKLSGFYARAQADTNTFSGSLSQLNNAWDEVEETVGGAIIQNEDVKNGIKKLTEEVNKLAESDDFKLWLSAVVEEIKTVIGWLGKLVGGIKSVEDSLFGAKKANKEYEEALEKLRAAQERARAAGHEFGKVLEEHKKQAEALKPAVDEVGKKHDQLRTATVKLVDTEAKHYEMSKALKWAMGEYSAKITDTVLPAMEREGRLADFVCKQMGLIPKTAKTTTTETKGYFDGLYNDVAAGFGDSASGLIGDICKGLNFADGKFFEHGINFKKYFNEAFDNVKEAFFRMIGEMVADKVLGMFKGLFSNIAKEGKEALGGVASVAGDLGKSAGGIASGLLSSLGSIGSIVSGITGVIELLKGPQKQTDVTYWLKMIKDNSQIIVNLMTGNFLDLVTRSTAKMESLNDDKFGALLDQQYQQTDFQRQIAESSRGTWDILSKAKFAASGIDAVVNSPTFFVAGERGPERVIVQPGGSQAPAGGASTVIENHFHISALDGASVLEVTKNKIAPMLLKLNRVGQFMPSMG